MTFLLAAIGRETLWVVADRRLTYSNGRPPVENAIKVALLEAFDGISIIGYAGLGATAKGTQPSQWLRNVLRGRNHSLENLLQLIAEVSVTEFPRHLLRLPGGSHVFLVPAFTNTGPHMFSLEHRIGPGGSSHAHREVRLVRERPGDHPIRLAMAGSGASAMRRSGHAWVRPLLNTIRANEEGRVSNWAVAKMLTGLNLQAHRETRDGTVGPRSVVLWKRRHGTSLDGGGHYFFDGADLDTRDNDGLLLIPQMVAGTDMGEVLAAVSNITVPWMDEWLDVEDDGEFMKGPPHELDTSELNDAVSKIDHTPKNSLD